MRISQLNLNDYEGTQDLLTQTLRDPKVYIAILSEQYDDIDNGRVCIAYSIGRPAIWTFGIIVVGKIPYLPKAGASCAWVEGFKFYSMYASLSASYNEFEHFLNELVEDTRDRRPQAVAGDVNAWAPEWAVGRPRDQGSCFSMSLQRLDSRFQRMGPSRLLSGTNQTPSLMSLSLVRVFLLELGLELYTQCDLQYVWICRLSSGAPVFWSRRWDRRQFWPVRLSRANMAAADVPGGQRLLHSCEEGIKRKSPRTCILVKRRDCLWEIILHNFWCLLGQSSLLVQNFI